MEDGAPDFLYPWSLDECIRTARAALWTAARVRWRRSTNWRIVNVVVEQPPKVEMGDYALPLAFELARKLRKAPKKIAEEIVAGLKAKLPAGFASLEVAGAGYINARLDRVAALSEALRPREPHSR